MCREHALLRRSVEGEFLVSKIDARASWTKRVQGKKEAGVRQRSREFPLPLPVTAVTIYGVDQASPIQEAMRKPVGRKTVNEGQHVSVHVHVSMK